MEKVAGTAYHQEEKRKRKEIRSSRNFLSYASSCELHCVKINPFHYTISRA